MRRTYETLPAKRVRDAQALCQEMMKVDAASPVALPSVTMSMRFGSVTAALAGIAGLASLLAYQAARSAREHRYTAARVMADYAELGAEGVATRVQGFLAGRSFPLLGAITSPPPATRGALLARGVFQHPPAPGYS